MTITTTKLYQILSELTNKETAETMANYIEEKVKEDVQSQTKLFLTKDDKIDIIDRLNRHFLILLSTLLTVGGILIGLFLNMISKMH